MSTTAQMTVEQFAQMRTAGTEDYELVEGELVPLSSATPIHAKVRGRLERLVEDYLERNPIGDTFAGIDCRLSERILHRPDISIFPGEHARGFDLNRTPVPFAPDIAVEVLSPSEGAIEVNRKALDYLTAGTREVWIIDNENGEVFIQTSADIRLLRGDGALESALMPGFSCALTNFLVRP